MSGRKAPAQGQAQRGICQFRPTAANRRGPGAGLSRFAADRPFDQAPLDADDEVEVWALDPEPDWSPPEVDDDVLVCELEEPVPAVVELDADVCDVPEPVFDDDPLVLAWAFDEPDVLEPVLEVAP